MSSGKSRSAKDQWQKATKTFKDKKPKKSTGFWDSVMNMIPEQADFSFMDENDKVKVRKSEAEKIK